MWVNRDAEDPRRRFLIQALAAGLFSGATTRAVAQAGGATVLGQVPGPLPPGRSFYEVVGAVRVNGRAADALTTVMPGDVVETGDSSRAIFAVGDDAFLMRENGRLETEAESGFVSGLRLLTGKLLSVFGRRRHRISTATATIGIRGTGVYVEAEPDRSYVCTCYGITELQAVADAASRETIESAHHDAPRYILASGAAERLITPAPFKNHDDEELALIEALVGRSVPFPFSFERYGRRRRRYDP